RRCGDSSKGCGHQRERGAEILPEREPDWQRLGFDKPEASADIQIIGVGSDIQPDLRQQQPRRAVYIPYTQAPPEMLGQMNVVVRAALDPNSLIPAVRNQIQSIDKSLPLFGIQTQADDADQKLRSEE